MWRRRDTRGGRSRFWTTPASHEPAPRVSERVEIAVTINGEPRSRITVPADLDDEDQIRGLALADEKVRALLQGKQIVKTLVVPGRLVNIVVK